MKLNPAAVTTPFLGVNQVTLLLRDCHSLHFRNNMNSYSRQPLYPSTIFFWVTLLLQAIGDGTHFYRSWGPTIVWLCLILNYTRNGKFDRNIEPKSTYIFESYVIYYSLYSYIQNFFDIFFKVSSLSWYFWFFFIFELLRQVNIERSDI